MTEITPEALEALSKKATQGEAMTNPRQALEEAFTAIHNLTLKPSDWDALGWNKADRFRRFLDAEAWTDAALMLVPEGSWFIVKNVMGSQPLTRDLFVADVLAEGDKGRPVCLSIPSSHPALAIAQAALRKWENGDG